MNNEPKITDTLLPKLSLEKLAWEKMAGLLPVIIQSQASGTVLMLGYMNRAALEQTLATQRVTFYSRSKQRLWKKGETSGHELIVKSIHVDCDHDSLLIVAIPEGPTCHLGNTSCFSPASNTDWGFIHCIENTVAQRQSYFQENSYTSQLFQSGIKRIAQKVGEEGVEMALASLSENPQEITEEAADLFFHLLVLLKAKGLCFSDVVDILRTRQK